MTKQELERREDIAAIAARHGFQDMAAAAINAGTTVERFRGMVLERIGGIQKVDTLPELGLSERDAAGFSLGAWVRSRADPMNRDLQRSAGLTMEISDAYRKGSGIKTRFTPGESICIPPEIETRRRQVTREGRNMTVGTLADGGYLKGTDHLASSFIENLMNQVQVEALGAMVIGNCVGDVAIPAKTGASTTEWIGEDGEANASGTGIFANVTGTPHTITGRLDISRKLLLQSAPAVDAIMETDLADQIGLGVDLATLHGTGANNQPQGLELISGITTVEIGAAGGAPILDAIVGLESAVAAGNANAGNMAFLTNAKTRGKLRRTFPNSTGGDTPMWTDGPDGYGRLIGYKAAVSNQVRSDLTKTSGSNLSAIFFGNWPDLVLFVWGGVELIIDPYSLSTKGALRLVAFKSVDVKVRHTASFARILDAVTT